MSTKRVRLDSNFYSQDVIDLAKNLIGKVICRKFEDGEVHRFHITETEAYCGEKDLACHACKGKTDRTSVMYEAGGHVYIYLIYGMYWMLNIVSGKKNDAQAVLIRGVEGADGPGKVGRLLKLDKSYYGLNLATADNFWLEDDGTQYSYEATPRIGIAYAGEPWVSKPWRFVHQIPKIKKPRKRAASKKDNAND